MSLSCLRHTVGNYGDRLEMLHHRFAGELTVRLAGGRSVVGAETRLHLPASDLQLVGIGQMRPAHVAHPLLLTSSALSHVDGHPGRPRRVPLHLRTRLQVTGFVFLQQNKRQ